MHGGDGKITSVIKLAVREKHLVKAKLGYVIRKITRVFCLTKPIANTKIGATTFSMTTLITTTFSITIKERHSMQCVVILNVIYSECHYVECRYAECPRATKLGL